MGEIDTTTSSTSFAKRGLGMKKRFSIVTTVFNDLPGLKLTARSVLKQSFPIEWIIVDADSGSETRKFLSSLESENHEIRWLSEKDFGLYDGMNKGFKMATGEVVLFLNAADSLIFNDTIEQVMQSYDSDLWEWAAAVATRIGNDGLPHSIWEYLDHSIGGLALGTRTFCHQACFYKRDFLERLLPYDVTNLASDHHVNVRAYNLSTPHIFPFVTTLFQDGGVSSNRPLSAAFFDLHKIRKEEKLLVMNSRILDLLVVRLTVLILRIGKFCWGFFRFVARRLIKRPKRVSPASPSKNRE